MNRAYTLAEYYARYLLEEYQIVSGWLQEINDTSAGFRVTFGEDEVDSQTVLVCFNDISDGLWTVTAACQMADSADDNRASFLRVCNDINTRICGVRAHISKEGALMAYSTMEFSDYSAAATVADLCFRALLEVVF